MAIAFCWVELSKPKIKDQSDLYFINGHFRDYDFDKHGGRYTIYTFRLKEFSNSFKIKADFLGDFKIDDFKNIDYGHELIISISKEDISNLNTNNSYFFVFTIADNKTSYLDTSYTIKRHNSKFIYYASILFVIVGLISIYYGQKWKRQNKQLQQDD